MKRYSAGMYGMVTDPDGEYYSRADLIAAGVLVPVKDENDFATPVHLVKLEDLG